MLDKLMDRLMEGAASAYMPQIEKMAQARKAELEERKSKVRTEPEKVEAWLDREIQKLENMDVKDVMKGATAGI